MPKTSMELHGMYQLEFSYRPKSCCFTYLSIATSIGLLSRLPCHTAAMMSQTQSSANKVARVITWCQIYRI